MMSAVTHGMSYDAAVEALAGAEAVRDAAVEAAATEAEHDDAGGALAKAREQRGERAAGTTVQ